MKTIDFFMGIGSIALLIVAMVVACFVLAGMAYGIGNLLDIIRKKSKIFDRICEAFDFALGLSLFIWPLVIGICGFIFAVPWLWSHFIEAWNGDFTYIATIGNCLCYAFLLIVAIWYCGALISMFISNIKIHKKLVREDKQSTHS